MIEALRAWVHSMNWFEQFCFVLVFLSVTSCLCDVVRKVGQISILALDKIIERLKGDGNEN